MSTAAYIIHESQGGKSHRLHCIYATLHESSVWPGYHEPLASCTRKLSEKHSDVIMARALSDVMHTLLAFSLLAPNSQRTSASYSGVVLNSLFPKWPTSREKNTFAKLSRNHHRA